MSASDESYDPKRTMQVTSAEVAEIAEAIEPATNSRRGPPPLPSRAPSPPAGATTGKKVLYGVIVVAMLAVAVVGGKKFADAVRGPAAPPATGPAPTATMTLPAIQMN